MDDAVRFAAGIGVVAVVLTILFLPGRQAAKAIEISWKEQTGDLVLEPVHAEAIDRD
jgi:hypothetical protein